MFRMDFKINNLIKVVATLIVLGILSSSKSAVAQTGSNLRAYETVEEVSLKFGKPTSDKVLICRNNDPILKQFECRHISFIVGGRNRTIIFRKMVRYRLKNGRYKYINPEFNTGARMYNEQEFYWVAIGTLKDAK
jgi:hypothetical protein